MKIAVLASEAAPYAKTGGLADVAGALPRHLAEAGHEVVVVLPLYRCVRDHGRVLRRIRDGGEVPGVWPSPRFSLWEDPAAGITVRFIGKDEFFDRAHLYGPPGADDPDNGDRFAFFARAALESFKVLDFRPDVLHVHDWQAAPALAYLKFAYAGDPFFRETRTVFTIHNLAYQGLFDRGVLVRIGLPEALFRMDALEFYGRVSFLKAGILYADAVTTVSPRYAREIQTPELGCGLDGLLRARSGALTGILNGIDTESWDPARDPALASRYEAADPSGKSLCRKDLLRSFGLPDGGPDLPIAGLVTRLAGQKGLDILATAFGGLFAQGLRLVILGAGDPKIESVLRANRDRTPSFFGLRVGFDESLARKIYAGSDLFLVPSRYEPCGLTQMYALRYGAVPVVRATGGLDDTVMEFDPETGLGTGFKFEPFEATALVNAVRRAVRLHARPGLWAGIRRNGMLQDFSWGRSAKAYLELYAGLASAHRD